MAKIRTDRLLKLADFLETIPRKAFDISLWVSRDADKPEGKQPGECGFAGCAVGWAAHAKLFRGLKNYGEGMGITYDGKPGFEAVDAVFGFRRGMFRSVSDEGVNLFSGESYPKQNHRPTPKQVAKRIRKFVATSSSSE